VQNADHTLDPRSRSDGLGLHIAQTFGDFNRHNFGLRLI
jgi:hypothetical protein